MSCLAACPACNRHVSTHETACPFCEAALPESLRCQPACVAPPGRLSRAALMAAGAALMGASCGTPLPAYGGVIFPDAGADTSTDAVNVPIYGGAAPALEQTANQSTPPTPRKN
jgi:hypothetical protein